MYIFMLSKCKINITLHITSSIESITSWKLLSHHCQNSHRHMITKILTHSLSSNRHKVEFVLIFLIKKVPIKQTNKQTNKKRRKMAHFGMHSWSHYSPLNCSSSTYFVGLWARYSELCWAVSLCSESLNDYSVGCKRKAVQLPKTAAIK